MPMQVNAAEVESTALAAVTEEVEPLAAGLISNYTNNAITGIIGGLLTILILSVV